MIGHLVFLRRVGSRILYEQMIGRATRLCPEIGKERFRIFDAVDLYAALKDATDMKPAVVNPLVTFEQLVREILEAKEEEHRRESLEELLAKLQRKRRTLTGEAEARFETAAGMDVKDLLDFLKGSSVGAAADYLTKHPALAPYLDRTVGTALRASDKRWPGALLGGGAPPRSPAWVRAPQQGLRREPRHADRRAGRRRVWKGAG